LETRIRKALTSASGQGQALMPEDLEPILVEYLYQLSPLLKLMNVKEATSGVHQVNRRSSVANQTPWFEGELTDTPSGRTTYSRDTLTLKILRAGGGVSGFLQAASKKFLNALEKEQLGAVENMADLFEYAIMWGNATADPYQFSGLDTLITTNRTDFASSKVTLTALDNMIDQASPFRGVEYDSKVLLMSSNMSSVCFRSSNQSYAADR
jgi:hypothetical protein